MTLNLSVSFFCRAWLGTVLARNNFLAWSLQLGSQQFSRPVPAASAASHYLLYALAGSATSAVVPSTVKYTSLTQSGKASLAATHMRQTTQGVCRVGYRRWLIV